MEKSNDEKEIINEYSIALEQSLKHLKEYNPRTQGFLEEEYEKANKILKTKNLNFDEIIKTESQKINEGHYAIIAQGLKPKMYHRRALAYLLALDAMSLKNYNLNNVLNVIKKSKVRINKNPNEPTFKSLYDLLN